MSINTLHGHCRYYCVDDHDFSTWGAMLDHIQEWIRLNIPRPEENILDITTAIIRDNMLVTIYYK